MTDKPIGADHPEWKKNQGRIKNLSPEERREMQVKGGKAAAEKLRQRRAMEKKLADKQGLLDEAVSAVMTEDPEVIAKIMNMIALKAQDPDDKGALAAADIFLKHTGITAPKQVEQKIEDNRSVDDIVNELEQSGAKVSGLKVVK